MTKTPTQLYPAGHFFAVWEHVAPVGVSLSDVCEPRYWQHVARVLRKFHCIHVVAEDFSFEVRLRVTRSDPGVLLLRRLDSGIGDLLAALPATPVDAPATVTLPKVDAARNVKDGLEVQFGGAHKWRVIDTTSAAKEVIAKGLSTQDEAEAARDNLIAARKG